MIIIITNTFFAIVAAFIAGILLTLLWNCIINKHK